MSTLTAAAANGLGGGGTLVPDLSALDSSAKKAKTPSELRGGPGLAAAAAPSGGSKALAIVATAPGTSEPLLDDSFFALMKVGHRAGLVCVKGMMQAAPARRQLLCHHKGGQKGLDFIRGWAPSGCLHFFAFVIHEGGHWAGLGGMWGSEALLSFFALRGVWGSIGCLIIRPQGAAPSLNVFPYHPAW